MTTAPVLTSRDVNLAAIATRALLDTLLEDAGLSFDHSILLSQVDEATAAGRDLTMDDVVRRRTIDLRRPAEESDEVVAAAVEAGLVTVAGTVVRVTDAGRALHDGIQAQVRDIVQRVYGSLSTEELVVARRVIDTVTERAREELARLRAA
jgi:hypothetical protein